MSPPASMTIPSAAPPLMGFDPFSTPTEQAHVMVAGADASTDTAESLPPTVLQEITGEIQILPDEVNTEHLVAPDPALLATSPVGPRLPALLAPEPPQPLPAQTAPLPDVTVLQQPVAEPEAPVATSAPTTNEPLAVPGPTATPQPTAAPEAVTTAPPSPVTQLETAADEQSNNSQQLVDAAAMAETTTAETTMAQSEVNISTTPPLPEIADSNLVVPPTAQPTVPSTVPAVATEAPTQPVVPLKSDPQPPAPPAKTFVNLLDVLVDQGTLTKDQATELMTQSIKQNKSVDVLITESKLVQEEQLAQAQATFYKVPYVKLSDVGVYPEALSLIPESVARHYGVLPFSLNQEDKTLSVAMRNPLDVTAVHFVEQKTGLRVISYYASQTEIERLIAEHYSQNLSSEVSRAVEQTEAIQKKMDFSDLSGKTIREAPVSKIVQTILAFSLKTRASDVHIEPQEDKTRVRYRIDGILQEKLILPKSVHNAVVSRIKILSGLKIDERRLPQDGRFDFTDHEVQVDLRVSTLPTVHGEKVVMRLLKKNAQVPSLEELGLTGLALRNMRDAIKVPHGIILVTGPTGSGKTTTLYSVLHTINSPRVNIVTLEDPVEYMITGVNQVQVNPQAGLTFASGLRSFLRQDPNIIMVGEIRDSETANLAVQAALTGHLVFATLHTSSAAGALPRLMDMGAEPFLLASSMTLVAAQRIARLINPEYKESYTPDPTVVADMQEVLGDKFNLWLKEHNMTKQSLVLYRAAEKRPETEPEYKGRMAIFEIMKVNESISKLILAKKSASDLEKSAIEDGMWLMKQDGYLKVLEGFTTIEEVLRVAQI